MTSEGLVYRVVEDFVEEMVEAARAGVAYVHCGPLSNCLEPFKYLNVFGGVLRGYASRDCVIRLEVVSGLRGGTSRLGRFLVLGLSRATRG